MAQQSKADRSTAAKKAASKRQQNDVLAELEEAKRKASAAIASVGEAAKYAGVAAISATKSAAARAKNDKS